MPNVSVSVSEVSASASGPCRDDPAVREEQRVREPLRDLLDVMRDHDDRRRRGRRGVSAEEPEELLACAEVEARGRLVEEQQFGVGHDRARDLHPLLLAVGEAAEATLGESLEAPLLEHALGTAEVDLLVFLVPAAGDRVGRGEHDIEHGLVARDLAGHRRGGEADHGPELEDVDLAERLLEHVGGALRRMHRGGRDLQQRGLARTVRPEDDPALVGVDAPRHRVEDQIAVADHRHISEL